MVLSCPCSLLSNRLSEVTLELTGLRDDGLCRVLGEEHGMSQMDIREKGARVDLRWNHASSISEGENIKNWTKNKHAENIALLFGCLVAGSMLGDHGCFVTHLFSFIIPLLFGHLYSFFCKYPPPPYCSLSLPIFLPLFLRTCSLISTLLLPNGKMIQNSKYFLYDDIMFTYINFQTDNFNLLFCVLFK